MNITPFRLGATLRFGHAPREVFAREVVARNELRVAVIGTRGFPNVQGGVEKHCEEIYPRVADHGFRVRVYSRAGYVKRPGLRSGRLETFPLWIIRHKHLEALVHTFTALLHAWLTPGSFDIVHVHGIGPSLVVPFARLLGFRVVVTNHGADYQRLKWGRLMRSLLRLGEALGTRYADQVIAVSRHTQISLERRFERPIIHIPNGASLPSPTPAGEFSRHLGIRPGEYILAVARWVPEKGLHDLISAFAGLRFDVKLVIAGVADHRDSYSKRLCGMAKHDHRVVLAGFVTGSNLSELYSNARVFVLPSYHEGLSIVLLEALSHGIPVLCSDIPANRELITDTRHRFPPGNLGALRAKLHSLLMRSDGVAFKRAPTLAMDYSWDAIAMRVAEVYSRLR